ncbi:MAG: efflux RND transporter permease subunit [bacterium]
MSDLDTKPHEPPASGITYEDTNLGLAGNTAKFFINSPLSPLFYITMLLLGLAGLILTPRQEDPQISVPMVDIFVQYPGASADEVASLAIQPLERIMSEIQGIKHVYSATERGRGIVTLQFEVGEEMEPSLVKVNDQLASNMDIMPPGVSPPLVKAKGIDDVPVVTLTLWSDKDYNRDGIPDVDDSQLRQLAHSVLQSIKEIPETGEGFVVGGRSEQMTIEVLPERLTGYGISLGQVAQAIKEANSQQQIGNVEASGSQFTVVTGSFLKTIDDINQLQVGNHNGVPVYVYDVAQVRQGPKDADQMVAYYTGAAAEEPDRALFVPAVTIAIAKKKGTNGVTVAEQIIERVEILKGRLIPNNVEVSVTRNYGQTAESKVNALMFKLAIATAVVFLLVWYAFRALKPAVVVLLVIPVVLLFTLFAAWILGFTIDRVSLFALIFSIGILVDDAIVVVENIYRRWLQKGETDAATAVDAVREVGNPTILATFTVIGALMPMGFVSGMMGPYMMPIPVLGATAMLISLAAAFMFTPWLAIHGWFRPSLRYLHTAEKREHEESAKLEHLYRRILIPLIEHPAKARMFKIVLWGSFLFACSFFYFKWLPVKMLPLDNKPEFSVVLDMPEGTALAETANRANEIANLMRVMPEVTAVQIYVGTARPYDFNGLVRHYYLRQQPWQAEVQVQLLDKDDRSRSSHEIAVDARAQIKEMVNGGNLRYAVVEMPPGPPVLQSVVAEVHGPDAATRKQVAHDLTQAFAQTESLRDVDNYMRMSHDYWHFKVDREKADRRGISVNAINQNLGMALGGMVLGDVKQKAGHEPVHIVIQVPLAERAQINRLGNILVQSQQGNGVPLRELGEFYRLQEDDLIYHKDLRPVEYVVADVGGDLAAPVYGQLQVQDILNNWNDGKPYITPDGVKLTDEIYWMGAPPDDTKSAFEWAGEWTVTYETFRDMGMAFGAALVLIYILVVWEFGNFRVPALIMAPIPLTLLGIIPAHAAFFAMGAGGEFTATSMIGWIALAGIIVRNSILLVDFSIHEVEKGKSVTESVILACQTRTRPILITALALVAASSVIFFDPIFQGMAISLAFGVLVSTVLTLVVIPLGCVKAADSICEIAGGKCPDEGDGGSSASNADKSGFGHFAYKIWHGVAATIVWAIELIIAIIRVFVRAFSGILSAASKPSAPVQQTSQVRESAEPVREAVDPQPASEIEPELVTEPEPEPQRATESAAEAAQSLTRRKSTTRKRTATSSKKVTKKAEAKAAKEEKASASPASAKSTKAEVRKKVKGAVTARKKSAAKKKASKPRVAKKTSTAAVARKKAGISSKTGTKSATTTKRGSERRGIRLKSLDDKGGDGLN